MVLDKKDSAVEGKSMAINIKDVIRGVKNNQMWRFYSELKMGGGTVLVIP